MGESNADKCGADRVRGASSGLRSHTSLNRKIREVHYMGVFQRVTICFTGLEVAAVMRLVDESLFKVTGYLVVVAVQSCEITKPKIYPMF